ncbi:YlxR family protein [Marisediminicola sp. UYEF4]|uniref:YlxR family protein n=1 Tax=Marisediminicola sp. UYEF4 TaxID=1756384 RepID=UPI00339230B2
MKNVRTCLGCRQRASATSLLRLVAHDGEIVMDHSMTLPGRGAWVHPSIDCLETALTRKAIGRSLRNPAAMIDGDALRQELRNHAIGAGNGALENRLNGPVNN